MNPRRSLIVAIVVAVLLGWSVWRAGPSADPPAPGERVIAPPGPVEIELPSARADASIEELAVDPRFLIDPDTDPLSGVVGEGLNSPAGSAMKDLDIVGQILDAWQTNFPDQGNPVGLNVEVTRALAGANRLKEPFLPSDHPAINADGELCDRWGSPLMFHQISKHHMELRSAGPDRIPYSEDDLVWNEAEPF